MKLRVDDFSGEVKSRVKSLYRPLRVSAVVSAVLGMLCAVAGFYMSYFAYIRVGIDSVLVLAAFIVGLAVCSIGIERFIFGLRDAVTISSEARDALRNLRKYEERIGSVYGLDPYACSMSVDIMDDGIVLGYSNGAEYRCRVPYKKVLSVLYNESTKCIVVCFRYTGLSIEWGSYSVEGYPFGGILLGSLYEEFEFESVLGRLRELVGSERIRRVDMTIEEMSRCASSPIAESIFMISSSLHSEGSSASGSGVSSGQE